MEKKCSMRDNKDIHPAAKHNFGQNFSHLLSIITRNMEHNISMDFPTEIKMHFQCASNSELFSKHQ